jgi:septum formation protein
MIVLASRSPRRADLLRSAGLEFVLRAADIDETPRAGEAALDYAQRLAEEKNLAIESTLGEIVLAADTVVVLGSEIMGKPAGAADARRMLMALSGRRHDVITAICLRADRRIIRDSASTAVWFSPMTGDEIESYIASGEPMDKAGAYGIQGIASRYIDRIDGSYTNVVGLPVALLYRRLAEFGTYS